MKKVRTLLAIIISVLMLSACSKSDKAIYNGTIKDYNGAEVVLMDALKLDGKTTPIDINSDGTFTLELPAEEPHVYFIIFSEPHSGFKIYAEKGLKATLDISFRPEIRNNQEIVRSVVDYDGDHEEIFRYLEKTNYFDAQNKVIEATIRNQWDFNTYRQNLRTEVDKMKKEVQEVGTHTFRQLMHNDYEERFVQSLFWYSEIGDKHDAEYLAFMDSIDHERNETIALLYAMFYRTCIIDDDKDANLEIFRMLPSLYNNDDIRNSVADNQMEYILRTMPPNLEEVFEAYKQSLVGHEIPIDILDAMKEATSMKAGCMATDFEMFDANGKAVRLSDFKGRVVYLDVWASWCGPCRAEIPHMASLYSRYKNNPNIVFVSVSIDENKEAWKNALNNENPAWPQYIIHNSEQSPLLIDYKIQSIPRFMLFDKEGRIIAINAPRPSDPQINDYIDKALK